MESDTSFDDYMFVGWFTDVTQLGQPCAACEHQRHEEDDTVYSSPTDPYQVAS